MILRILRKKATFHHTKRFIYLTNTIKLKKRTLTFTATYRKAEIRKNVEQNSNANRRITAITRILKVNVPIECTKIQKRSERRSILERTPFDDGHFFALYLKNTINSYFSEPYRKNSTIFKVIFKKSQGFHLIA